MTVFTRREKEIAAHQLRLERFWQSADGRAVWAEIRALIMAADDVCEHYYGESRIEALEAALISIGWDRELGIEPDSSSQPQEQPEQ